MTETESPRERRPDMTDEELKKLAVDIYHGHVFTDRNVRPGDEHLLGSIFMVLMIGGPELGKQLQDEDATLLYESLEKAGPRSINGYPTFLSFRYLRRGEAERMFAFYERYSQLQQEFEGKPEQP